MDRLSNPHTVNKQLFTVTMETNEKYEIPWLPKNLWANIRSPLRGISGIISVLLTQMWPQSLHFAFPWQPLVYFQMTVFFL